MSDIETVSNSQPGLPEGIANAARQASQAPVTNRPASEPEPKQEGAESVVNNGKEDLSDSPMFGDRYSKEEAPKADDGVIAPEIEAEVSKDPSNQFTDMVNDEAIAPAIAYLDNLTDKYGVDFERAFSKAFEYNDPSLIDTHYIKELMGDDADAYIKQVGLTMTHVHSSVEKRQAALYESVPGGRESFESSKDVFNEKADPTVKKQVRLMLDSGDLDLQKAAMQMVVKFGSENGKVVIENGSQPIGSPAVSQQGLDAKTYQTEYAKLASNPRTTPAEFQALRERRVLGKKQGK